jgi:hypothetical protein
MWGAMKPDRNGTAHTPESKLQAALDAHIQSMSDAEIERRIEATEKIRAERNAARKGFAGASRATPQRKRPR